MRSARSVGIIASAIATASSGRPRIASPKARVRYAAPSASRSIGYSTRSNSLRLPDIARLSASRRRTSLLSSSAASTLR